MHFGPGLLVHLCLWVVPSLVMDETSGARQTPAVALALLHFSRICMFVVLLKECEVRVCLNE